MPTRTLRGVSFHFEDRGGGPPLVLVHGFPVDCRMWEAQVAELSSHSRTIAPDLRGFGRSVATDSFTIDSLADDLHALLVELDARQCVLAGYSMGGYVALAYVARYAADLRGLILVDTKADADNPQQKEARLKMAELARARGAQAIADEMVSKQLAPETPHRRPSVAAALHRLMEECPPATIEHALMAMRDRPDRAALLSTFKLPTLIIVGDSDSITPVSIAQSMQQRIPGAKLEIIRGAGHMSPMEQPAQVTRAMSRFLKAHAL
jgi:pimeloyl-ACP methyl ester carboxylesterase